MSNIFKGVEDYGIGGKCPVTLDIDKVVKIVFQGDSSCGDWMNVAFFDAEGNNLLEVESGYAFDFDFDLKRQEDEEIV